MTIDIATSSVVSQACRIMEIGPVASFADGSPQALALAEQYPEARDLVLQSHDWSAARVVAALAPVTVAGLATDPDLAYSYQLPADCLKLWKVHGTGAFRVDGRVIRSETAETLTIRYARQIEREADLGPDLRLAVAQQLAHLLAPVFVGSRTKRDSIEAGLERVLSVARVNDAHSASAHQLDGDAPDTSWVSEALR
ncbi:hypothetical protein [Mameliella alba]|uniref:hypothetical protein n=1 Tax=Mameliella alba TaxID=561184 RepID=UPI000B52F63D|nr:hypothetical protein [Mameliella alba]OWV39398.1 hypothetical protein CDZ95_26080 [Mameliella alba]